MEHLILLVLIFKQIPFTSFSFLLLLIILLISVKLNRCLARDELEAVGGSSSHSNGFVLLEVTVLELLFSWSLSILLPKFGSISHNSRTISTWPLGLDATWEEEKIEDFIKDYLKKLTLNLFSLLGVTVMSLMGSQSSLVENILVREFSSNIFGSKKHVTEPIFRWLSLGVSCFWTFLSLFSLVAAEDDEEKVEFRFEKLRRLRSLRIRLPCRLRDL